MLQKIPLNCISQRERDQSHAYSCLWDFINTFWLCSSRTRFIVTSFPVELWLPDYQVYPFPSASCVKWAQDSCSTSGTGSSIGADEGTLSSDPLSPCQSLCPPLPSALYWRCRVAGDILGNQHHECMPTSWQIWGIALQPARSPGKLIK